MELGDWLISNGAQNLMLITREEAITSYQQFRIKFWQFSAKNVSVITTDVTEENVEKILKKESFSKTISGIFILTEVMKLLYFYMRISQKKFFFLTGSTVYKNMKRKENEL